MPMTHIDYHMLSHALRLEEDVFTFDLTREDGQHERFEFVSHDNKEHPRRFVQWSQDSDNPHTVCFVYEDAERGHALGLYVRVGDLSLLDVLRLPAQVAQMFFITGEP